LNAAVGWLGLGNYLAANEELERIEARLRAHPDVLQTRCHVCVLAKQWDAVLAIAEVLVKIVPERPSVWIDRSNALHFLGRYSEAYDKLTPALKLFPDNWLFPYNLACFCSRMGKLDDSRQLLAKAIELDKQHEVKLRALDDPDLEPLWKEIGNLDE